MDGDDTGDDTMPELDENGEEFGGPVKSFLEHMEDLRWVLIRCVAALAVAMVACLRRGAAAGRDAGPAAWRGQAVPHGNPNGNLERGG